MSELHHLIAEAEQRGAERERAKIVAWLRTDNPAGEELWCDEMQVVATVIADAIERGEHHG